MDCENKITDDSGKSDELKTELLTHVCPSKRSAFGLCSLDKDVYLFGGYGEGNKYLDDFWHINGISCVFVCLYVLNSGMSNSFNE